MVPESLIKANEYKLKWMTTEGESLELEGFAGAEIWLDPEGYTFMRLNYGSYERLSEVVTNMIKAGFKFSVGQKLSSLIG